MTEGRVTLISRAGCHLCEVARAELTRLSGPLGFTFGERLIDDDPDLEARYGEYVPVVLVDGRVAGWYRVDAGRLAAALRRDERRPPG
jgi:hypothetical protein